MYWILIVSCLTAIWCPFSPLLALWLAPGTTQLGGRPSCDFTPCNFSPMNRDKAVYYRKFYSEVKCRPDGVVSPFPVFPISDLAVRNVKQRRALGVVLSAAVVAVVCDVRGVVWAGRRAGDAHRHGPHFPDSTTGEDNGGDDHFAPVRETVFARILGRRRWE
ncbi:hypothetical protein B0H13DRAFT_1851918 [Mycena leptocephala]|nr:hypothetical protein B0H13DRAFT_1851918 [Mycena leptocephala]